MWVPLEGRLSRDKERLLAELDALLTADALDRGRRGRHRGGCRDCQGMREGMMRRVRDFEGQERVRRFLARAYSRSAIPYLTIGVMLVIIIVVVGREFAHHINAIDSWIAGLGPWSVLAFIGLFVIADITALARVGAGDRLWGSLRTGLGLGGRRGRQPASRGAAVRSLAASLADPDSTGTRRETGVGRPSASRRA